MTDNEIIAALMETGLWGEKDAQMGLEANFSCQYCGKDLLSSVDNYKEWQTDHLVPVSSGGLDEQENYVICCRTCNFIKGRWDPRKMLSSPVSEKEELIQIAREYIKDKRQYNSEMLAKFKKIVGHK